MNWRYFWIKKRFNKVKKLTVEKEDAENYPMHYLPVCIVEGDESKTGTGDIEINFDNINKETDIMLDVEKAEKEFTDTNNASIYLVDKQEVLEKGEIKLYYGVNHKIMRLFDRFFHKKHQPRQSQQAVYHLTDSQ